MKSKFTKGSTKRPSRKSKKLLPLGLAVAMFSMTTPLFARAATTSLANTGASSFTWSNQLALGQKPMMFGPATAYQNNAASFPSSWNLLGGNQQHNSAFSVPANAPSYLTTGTFWASPLTGDEFLRLARGFNRYPQDGGQAWGAEVAQWLGNVTGVSVVSGIVYVEESNGSIFAVDAATGMPIWQAMAVNGNMGDAVVTTINGRPIIFVGSGDVGFTTQHSLQFANNGNPPGPTVRGANYSAMYAIDGLTGKQLWKFDTQGEAMPTPVYHNGTLFFNTGDGHLYALDAQTGALISKFQSPGFSSMSSANYYIPQSGPLANHVLVIYGTQDQNYLMAVDETNPKNPTVAWRYMVPNAVNTGLGDVPPVVDPKTGLVLTDALVNDSGALNLDVFAVDASTGQLKWSHLAGNGKVAKPVAFKGSVPMVHNGILYVGDLLDETYQSYDEATGNLRWSTQLTAANGQAEPRAPGTFYNGKIILATGRDIYTIDPTTGTIDNTFSDPGMLAVWGISKPTIVGNEMYIGSISGWVFAMPANFVMTNPGFPGQPLPPQYAQNLQSQATPPQPASYYNPFAAPSSSDAAQFPNTWLAYAGNPSHNGVVAQGPSGVSWQTGLNDSLPLSAAPRDAAIQGTRTATVMTGLAFGVGTGVTPANGILYVGDGRYTVNAINAMTGKVIWTYNTINNNFGQPLVTPNTVVVSSGDPWFNFAAVQQFASNSPSTHLGASFQNLHGLNPQTGAEKWTFYTRGTDMMTPLYYNGNLYWVNGNGNVWAINANTGKPLSTFVDSAGNPILHVGGYNTINSANLYIESDGTPIMVVGTAKPNKMYGINLNTDQVVWTQDLSSLYTTNWSGFGDATPVIDQKDGIMVMDTLVNPDGKGNATLAAVAMNPATGQILWSKDLGSGPIPDGFAASTPVYQQGEVYLSNPLTEQELALNVHTGTVDWQTSLGQIGAAPGVVVGSNLIQAAGPNLYTLDTKTGRLLNTYHVGGDFSQNNPTVVGNTLYIGNGYGWAMAMPLSTVTGAK